MVCIGIKLEFSTTLFAKIVHFMGREGFMRVNSVSNDSFYGVKCFDLHLSRHSDIKYRNVPPCIEHIKFKSAIIGP